MKKASTRLLVAGQIFCILGGLIGIFITCHIAFGKEKIQIGEKSFIYDEGSRKKGKIMLGVAIAVIILTFINQFAS